MRYGQLHAQMSGPLLGLLVCALCLAGYVGASLPELQQWCSYSGWSMPHSASATCRNSSTSSTPQSNCQVSLNKRHLANHLVHVFHLMNSSRCTHPFIQHWPEPDRRPLLERHTGRSELPACRALVAGPALEP